MRLEPRPRPEQVHRVTAKLITTSTILHLSSDELERAVNQEQMENPALEVEELHVCLFCGTRMYGQTCIACGHFARPEMPVAEESTSYEIAPETLWSSLQQGYDFDNYGFAEIDRDDEFDLMASIPTGETLAEVLLQQLMALVSPTDEPIAEQVVGNLNERGYLEISIQEIADHLQVPLERVAYVLSQLHTLEPLGIGARDLRECLLIQLQALNEQETTHPLATILIDRYLEHLGRSQFHEIARDLKIPEQEVRQASHYIRTMLNPFPAHTYRAETQYVRHRNDASYMRPDVIIRRSESGFEVELIEEKRYRFRMNSEQGVSSTGAGMAGVAGAASDEVQRYMHYHT